MVDVLFPLATGTVVSGLRSTLAGRSEAYASGVTVQPKLPAEAQRTQRMVTVRNDGGPTEGVLRRHRYGFNVWAESAVNAEKLANLCMAVLPALADGDPVVAVQEFTGPFEVIDDLTDILTVGGVTLSHYYFSCVVSYRGTDL